MERDNITCYHPFRMLASAVRFAGTVIFLSAALIVANRILRRLHEGAW